MGAAPVLIMLAAVGVDYGWQPDGTTSQRGDNIEYIVQISPDQVQQLRTIGEITSTIDPSIQGRVSRIVVTVGTDPLPKDAGRVAVLEASTTTALGDDQTVPIPELSEALAIQRSPEIRSGGDRSDDSNASVMKPDPQAGGPQSGGGFQMPESPSAAAQSALEQIRSRTAEGINQLGAQARGSLDAQANAFTQAAQDAASRAASNLPNAINSLAVPNTGRGNVGVSSGPVPDRENRWTDLAPGSVANPTNANGGPSTAPVDPAARTAPWSDFGPPQPADPRALAGPALGNQSLASPSSTYSSPAGPFGDSNASNTSTATTRDPSDPKWSGYGNSSNFGSLPGGANPPATGYEAPPGFASTPVDPRQASSVATLPTGLTQDAQGNIVDSLGRLVDRNGRPMDPNSRAAVNATAPLADRYGGSHAPATYANTNQSPPAADRFGTASPYDPHVNSTNHFPSAQPASSPTLTPQQYAQQKAELDLVATRELLRSYQERDARQRDAQAAQTRLINYEDETTSASDQRAAAAARGRMEQDRMPPATKQRSVSAQFFFNFVLLISIVGNAYLIFETNNLRRKFRNMINSVRSSKVTAQAVT